MMYDNTYFYFAANVRDESPGHFSDASWAATAVEYYLSNKNIGTALEGDHLGMLDSTFAYDFQLNISFSDRLKKMVINYYGGGTGNDHLITWNNQNVNYKLWDAGDGYIIEGRIPWDSLKSKQGRSAKFVPGTRVAAAWSIYHMSQAELSGDFKGYAYSRAGKPAWAGAANWHYVDVKEQAFAELNDLPVTSVEIINANVPTSFTLSPAYPNPFNPGTNIEYTLKTEGVTSLKVYSILGELVATLVNNVQQNPGTYRVRVDMSGSPSGVYVYVLEQSGSRVAQKMVLLK
jgi:hypothetical protein